MDVELQGKTAIVTGGTRNLGRSISHGLLGEGANVVATFRRDAGAAEAFLAEISPNVRSRVRVYQLNVAYSDNCAALVSHAMSDFGGVDILVNNAGVMSRETVQEITDESFDWMMHNTLRSAVYMSRAVFDVMKQRGGGRIVNMSSEAPRTGNPAELTYLCAKAGVEGFTRALARMGGPHGITANAVAAHVIASGMGDATLSLDPTIVSRIPLGRPGHESELVFLVVFLCSDACQYLTGQTVHLNGGRIMHA